MKTIRLIISLLAIFISLFMFSSCLTSLAVLGWLLPEPTTSSETTTKNNSKRNSSSTSTYGDISGAEYAGKSYEMDLNYSIEQLRNKYLRECNNSGFTVYKIEKLSSKEEQLLEDALEEYRLRKDDVYTVQIGITSSTPMRILKLVVRIDSVSNDGSYHYTWWSIGKIYY